MGIGSALISAGGAILGGLFGKSSATVMSPGQQLKSTVRAAKEMGIHPLAALGSNLQYTPVPQYNNPMGPAVSQAADAIAKIPEGNLAKQSAASAIDVNKAQADLLRAQTHRVQTEVQANLRNGTGGVQNISNPSKSPHLFTTVTGEKGQQIRVPDMQRAPDLETAVAARLEDATFIPWVKKLIEQNDPRVPLIDKYIYKASERLHKAARAKLLRWWASAKKNKARTQDGMMVP